MEARMATELFEPRIEAAVYTNEADHSDGVVEVEGGDPGLEELRKIHQSESEFQSRINMIEQ